MQMERRIRQKLQSLQPQYLDIINESHMHSGPATESHFKVILVSDGFDGVNAVRRHQQVYGLLGDELKGGVHALALHLHTPGEWEKKQGVAPKSPACRGGSKEGNAS